MFVRAKRRFKDGKEHRYWSVVDNRRRGDGRWCSGRCSISARSTIASARRGAEAQYGRSERVWIMDRGIPTEATLAAMRAGDPPVSYLVGTPKGRLTRLEKAFTGLPASKQGRDQPPC